MKEDPIQIFEKVLTQNNQYSNYWQVYFRNQNKNIIDSQTIVSASNCQYCLNGSLLTINYSGNGGDINLPYKVAENQIINYWENSVLKMLEITKNDLKITVPLGSIKFTSTILVRVS